MEPCEARTPIDTNTVELVGLELWSGRFQTIGPRRAQLVGTHQRHLWHYYILGEEKRVQTLVVLPDHLSGAAGAFQLATATVSAGYQVVLIDWPEHVHTSEEFLDELEMLLYRSSAMETIPAQVHVAGVGLGGLLALRFAQRYPRHVASLILSGVLWQPQTLLRMLPSWTIIGRICSNFLFLPRSCYERWILDSGRATIRDRHWHQLFYPIFRLQVQQSTLGSLCTRLCLLRSTEALGAIRLPEERMTFITPLPWTWSAIQTAGNMEFDELHSSRWPYTGPPKRSAAYPTMNQMEHGTSRVSTVSGIPFLLWSSLRRCWFFWTASLGLGPMHTVPDDVDMASLMLLFPRARRSYLKGSFNNYAYLVSPAEFALHVLVHLRRQMFSTARCTSPYNASWAMHPTLQDRVDERHVWEVTPADALDAETDPSPSAKTRRIPTAKDMVSIAGPGSASTSWSTAHVSTGTSMFQDAAADSGFDTDISSHPESETTSDASRDIEWSATWVESFKGIEE
jgi:pimeloyl-ACP methyl ester carboxylesterase